jgi:hypothetical protein
MSYRPRISFILRFLVGIIFVHLLQNCIKRLLQLSLHKPFKQIAKNRKKTFLLFGLEKNMQLSHNNQISTNRNKKKKKNPFFFLQNKINLSLRSFATCHEQFLSYVILSLEKKRKFRLFSSPNFQQKL